MRRALALVALALASHLAEAKPKTKPNVVDPCAAVEGATGPGSLDPFRPPAAKAVELNAAGKIPYRLGKWEEARAQYHAAEAADPDFLAPKLNVACSFVRQEHFAEATAEVVALLDSAYVPWAREVREAADLGALKVRPEMKEIERAMAAAAARWGEGLEDSAIFIARQRPPLRIPDGPGVFILNQRQEVWAYTPRTRRYRQLTAEDGHVVALAQTADARRILYVTAEKLVRTNDLDLQYLRGVVLHQLTLATMAEESPARVEADVRALEIRTGPRGFIVTVLAGKAGGTFEISGGALVASPFRPRGQALTTLTATGPRTTLGLQSGVWRGLASYLEPTRGEGGQAALELNCHRSTKPIALAPKEGAGRVGLPIP